MKKFITLIFSFSFLLTLGTFGQTNVYFQVNHMLGASPFAYGTATTNNLGNDFNVSRLEYYFAEITLVHDGGMETVVPNLYILADAGTQVNEMLGSFSITNLEAVKFGIGVDSVNNHADPSLRPAGHPLAPRFPAMHWGWAAGYRFVAMEGNSGSGLGQIYQIHALGDDYYFETTINTSGSMQGNDLYIVLEADYEMALKDIDVSSGVITHGDFDEAIDLLNNFNLDVFSEGTFTVNREELVNAISFSVAPNPNSGLSRLSVDAAYAGSLIKISDVAGRLIQEIIVPVSGQMEIEMNEKGLFFVSLEQDGQRLATQKVLVTR